MIARSKIYGVMKSIGFFILLISILIDGKNDGFEWGDAEAKLIFDGESNSRVNYAAVKNKIIADENALYLCFIYIDPYLEPDNTNVGISVTTENSDYFEFNVTDSAYRSDTFDHSFDGAIYIDKNNGATCEIRLGFKSGIPEMINLDVRFIDSSGAYSNKYLLSIINKSYTELYGSAEDYDYDYEDDYVFTRKAEKTTVTTRKEKTEFYIQTSPPYSYVRKTKAPKTTVTQTTIKSYSTTTSKAKITKKKQDKTVKATQVYVITEQITEVSSTVELATTAISDTSAVNNDSPKTYITKGKKYKIIIGVISAVSFTSIAIASSKSSKKDN